MKHFTEILGRAKTLVVGFMILQTAISLKAASTGTVNINLATTTYPFRGIGWNVNAGNFQSATWAQAKTNLDSMQMQFVRVILHPEFWHPDANTFVTNNSWMQRTTQFLQYCQDNNITVWLHNWKTGGKFDETVEWPTNYWWLANVCFWDPQNQQGLWSGSPGGHLQGPETDHPYSDEKFASVVTKVVDYWVNQKGFSSVKYLGIWNEPNGLWSYWPRSIGTNVPPNYIEGMNRLYNKTWYYDKFIRNLPSIRLVGCDISPLVANDSMSDVGTTLASWNGGHRVDDYLDSISFHNYTTNYSDMCTRVKQQIYANNFDGSIENILVGEIGDPSFALTNAQGRAEHAMDCARKIIGFSKQGAYSVLRWWYNGTDQWGATDNAGLNPVPQHFNPVKLYCNTLPKVSYDYYIKQTDVQSTSTYPGSFFDSVCLSFWDPVASRNKIAIWLVNNSVYESRSIRVNFSNLSTNKTFRKKLIVTSSHFNYQCDIQDYGIVGTATPATPYIDDGLWGKCIQVYVEE